LKGGKKLNRKWLLPTILMLGLLLAGVFPTGASAAERSSWLAKAAHRAQQLAAQRAVVGTADVGSGEVSEPAPQPSPEPNPENATKTIYTVQTGDSLYLIGKKFGVTPAAIKTANNLPGDSIYPGQRLTIPVTGNTAPSVETVIYTVRWGDSLYLISKRFGISVSRIKAANGLKSDTIYPGQQLKLPGSITTTPVSSPAAPGTSPATPANGTSPEASPGTSPAGGGTGGENVRYTVQQGDSLYKIAQKYWVSITALKAANGLSGDEIYVGQVLIIPAAANRAGQPEVSRGLSLSREDIDLIARVVYAEARGEIYEGQVAVAAVILNRLRHPDFPKTIRGIVYEKYAFETVANGQINQVPNAQAHQAVQDALNGWDPTGGALYFWNPAGTTSKWIQSRTIIKQIGNHVFGI
jgi:N-acetylmuramoyl-L-alanine amidase